ncbi:MAG: histidine phosphatase family protein [Betaproteobacteria bacterium]|nr:histidine phosphatase family protein [Betaproteobacteria bacterium]
MRVPAADPSPPHSRRRLYLMRHGSVSYFDANGKPVSPETVPLNAAGRTESAAAGQLFAAQGVRFDRVVVSGLARTVETAGLVLRAADQELPIEPRRVFEEIRGGRLADINDSQLWQAFTESTAGIVDRDVRFLGGESIGELQDRVIPALEALLAEPGWQVMLLVLHGAVNRALLSWLVSGQRWMLGAFEQSPACINVIDIGASPRDVVLRAINLCPVDFLHPGERITTMEKLHGEYLRYRNGKSREGSHDGSI